MGLANAQEAAPPKPAASQDFNQLKRTVQRSTAANEVEGAVRAIRALADSGHGAAAKLLGDLYSRGESVEADGDVALKYYGLAADKGDASALRSIGDMYRLGRAIAADRTKALESYRTALKEGDKGSRLPLGRLLLAGEAAEVEEGLSLINEAAEDGDRWAIAALGDIYSQGKYVEVDGVKAEAYYQNAADLGVSSVFVRLGDMYAKGLGVAKDAAVAASYYRRGSDADQNGSNVKLARLLIVEQKNPAELAEGLSLLEKAGQEGDSSAYITLAEYFRSEDDTQDINKSISFYERAAALGTPSALRAIGDIYRNGNGVTVDLPVAAEKYREAINAGDASSKVRLGQLLVTDMGGAENVSHGLEVLGEAAEGGDRNAMVALANLYRRGDGVRADGQKAIAYFQQAADAGATYGLRNIGDIYREGKIVRRDLAAAERFYKAALDAGYSNAVQSLAGLYMSGDYRSKSASDAMALLKQQADAGNPSAARQLFFSYAAGRGKSVKKDVSRAEAILATYKPLLKEDEWRQDGAYLLAAGATSVADYRRLAESINDFPSDLRRGAITSIRTLNQNAYVYVVQSRLKSSGLYNGPLNGMLTTSTIKAISTLCANKDVSPSCKLGPLSYQGSRTIAEALN